MIDETESYRRQRVAELNAEAAVRAELEGRHGQVWDSTELRRDFDVIGFAAPFVVVRVIATRRKGSLEFQHSPRLYFNFQAD